MPPSGKGAEQEKTKGFEQKMPSVFDDIFKNYDVRGLFPEQLNEEVFYRIGRAFASHLKCKTVAVGRDARIGGERLCKALASGLAAQGCRVIDVGLISTDMIYFAVGKYGFDAGCMVTASHNPKEWNGIKFVGKGAIGISSETGLSEVKALAEKARFREPRKKGRVETKEIMPDFVEKVLSFTAPGKAGKLHVVVDASNGMVSKPLNAVEKSLPIRLTKMFFELDGSFPNHEPNPLDPKALEALQRRVLEEKADLGAIFDGDGDRMFMVDEKGQVVNGSELTCLIASAFLKRLPGSKILYTPVMSKVVRETIEANGGIPVLERVGHAIIKVRMRKENALFGGELSGHFYFRDNFFADSGLIALVVALGVVSASGKKLSELIKPYRKYFSIPEANSDVRDKAAKIAEIEAVYSAKANSTSRFDGFTADFGKWWFNVRPSGTENKLRLNLEAESKALLEEKKEELLNIIRS